MLTSHYALPPKNAPSIERILDKSPRRRIVSENLKWDQALVPRLRDACVKVIVDHVTTISDLHKLEQEDRAEVVQRIPIDLPLPFLLSSIPDDKFWEKNFKKRWKKCRRIVEFRNWRNAFLEHYIMELIDKYKTTDGGFRIDEGVLPHLTSSVRHLEIKQVFPSVKPEIEENEDQMAEEYWPIDLSRLLRLLPNIVKLSISFCVLKAHGGLNSSSFRYTRDDYNRLCDGIRNYRYMQYLQIHRSGLTKEDLKIIIGRLQQLPSLRELDFSHNLIGPKGAIDLMEFLTDQKDITKLNVCNNYLGDEGAVCIAEALKNTALTELNLKFNRVGNDGAKKLFESLYDNNKLCRLNIASNDILEESAEPMAMLLEKNKTLKDLDISGNDIGGTGMEKVRKGLAKNKQLVVFEIRFTGCDAEMEKSFKEKMAENQTQNDLLGPKKNFYNLLAS